MFGWEGITYREYLTWQAWFDEEWNRPSRTDHYIMKLTAVAGKLDVENLDQLKISFVRDEGPREETMEQKAARVKAIWDRRLKG